MSPVALHVRDVGKCYTQYRSNIERFLTWLGVSIRPTQEYWALKNISFTLRAGEALAVIGPNGAGKSTLLKLITGTVRATKGTVIVNGNVAAILELGLGFNAELTGRQNVALAGGLMGLPPKKIHQVMPEIEEFAELGEFFDQPLRVYSSGMQARLAFSVVTAIRPDVLIVDEALSVGDSYFQHKSFTRIRQFKEEGTSILFVSHSMADVRTLCERVILLEKGEVIKEGLADEVTDYYNALVAEKENAQLSLEQRHNRQGWLVTKSGTGEAVITELLLRDAATSESVAAARVGQKLRLSAHVFVNEDIDTLVLGYMLRDRLGHVVWGTNTWYTDQRLTDLKGGQKVTFDLEFTCSLGPGSYSFSPALVSTETHFVNNFEWIDNALVFDVVNADRPVFIGCNWLDANFCISVND